MIKITQDNLKEVEFDNVVKEYVRKSTIDGKEVSVTYKVNWNGLLGDLVVQQATQVQAINRYNVIHPITGTKEFEDKAISYSKLAGTVYEMDAVSERTRVAKVKELRALDLLNASLRHKEGGNEEEFKKYYELFLAQNKKEEEERKLVEKARRENAELFSKIK